MAAVLIGGVLSSTLLTLVLVPGVYTMLDDLGQLPGRLRRRRPRPAPMDSLRSPQARPAADAPWRPGPGPAARPRPGRSGQPAKP
jgi:hypothetical protein